MMRLLSFAKVARDRFKSSEDYVKFQRFQAYQIINKSHLIKEAIRGKKVLDLGSGKWAGYADELAKYAKDVYALDLNTPDNFANKGNIIPIKADALELPFKNETFDFCFCSSLIEHVAGKKEYWRK